MIEKKQLKYIASREINNILDALNIKFSRRGNSVFAACPCEQHGGDGSNPHAFSWRDDYEHWICFSHNCQDKYGSDIFALIRSVLDCSFQESIKWLQEFIINRKIDITNVEIDSEKSDLSNKLFIHKPLDEQRIKFLRPDVPHEYLINRGFSKEVLAEYEIGFWCRLGTFMHNRIICPIRDDAARLIGFTGRTIIEEEFWEKYGIKAKWLHGRYYDRWPNDGELKLGSILFNLYKAKKFIDLYDRKIILVEGILDGLKLEMAGIRNWVGNLGGKFTSQKRDLLVKYGFSQIINAYDFDIGGDDASLHLQKIIGNLIPISRITLPTGKDPGDLSIEEIRNIFNVTNA